MHPHAQIFGHRLVDALYSKDMLVRFYCTFVDGTLPPSDYNTHIQKVDARVKSLGKTETS